MSQLQAGTPTHSVADAFARVASEHASRLAVVADGTAWTYAELDRRAQAIGAGLRALGVAKGALVGLHLRRSPDAIAAILGVLNAGAVYVPLDPSYPVSQLEFICRDAAPTLLISEPDDCSQALVSGGSDSGVLKVDCLGKCAMHDVVCPQSAGTRSSINDDQGTHPGDRHSI